MLIAQDSSQDNCKNCKLSGVLDTATSEVVCPSCGSVLLQTSDVISELTEDPLSYKIAIHPVIRRIADKLHLPRNVQLDAQKIFRQRTKTRGRRRLSNLEAAACIYVSCRKARVARTLKEISSAINVSIHDLSRLSRRIITESSEEPVPQIRIANFVSRICNSLSFSESTKRRAILFSTMQDALSPLLGRSPLTIAGAIIYLVGVLEGEEVSLDRIQSASGISSETISEAFQEIKEAEVLESLMHDKL